MAHFAKVVNGKVDQVIVAEPDFFDGMQKNKHGNYWKITNVRNT